MRKPDVDEQQIVREDENLLGRWSRRKHEARSLEQEPQEVETTTSSEPDNTAMLTDTDMPLIESLNEDSDYSGFLSPKVSETLRKQALHKLFHSPAFNIRDGLDDYDGVYTEFEKLGDIVTADMRYEMERETKRQMQRLAEQQSTENNEQIEVASVYPESNEIAVQTQAHADPGSEEVVEQNDDEVEP